MAYHSIDFEITRGVALITLNRPAQLNTLSAQMIEELGNVYRRCDERDEIQVVVLTGAGTAFCAGADLSGGGGTFDANKLGDFPSCPTSMQPWDIRKPVIAACNGHAIGVGLSTALQCDLRVFAEQGKYGLLQNRLGVVADNAVEWSLVAKACPSMASGSKSNLARLPVAGGYLSQIIVRKYHEN